jgi:hypothetical protein
MNQDTNERQPITGLTFSTALALLKDGASVARAGWNGRGMWVTMVKDWNGNFGRDLPPTYSVRPFMAIKNVDDSMCPWAPSQTDAVADDWCVVEA